MWQIRGELNKGAGPLGRRGERTPDQNHYSKGEEKGEKNGRKLWVEAGSSFTAAREDIKGSSWALFRPGIHIRPG